MIMNKKFSPMYTNAFSFTYAGVHLVNFDIF